jgi:hypothetical protein
MAHVRGFGSFLLGVLALVLLAGIGVGIYNAGLEQGIAQTAQLPAGTVPYYAYGWHWGGGIFGLFFPILFLFIIFGLIRAAFRGGRGGWGHHGYGYGPGKWGPGGSGPWMGDRDSRIAEWHRQLHEAEGSTPGASSGSTGTGPAGSGPGSTDRPS